MKTYLGIAGLVVVVGVVGCGGAEEACDPAGTWSVTSSPLPGNDCDDGMGTATEVVTVSNGKATITNTEEGVSHEAPLDSSCHMSYVTAVSTPDFVAAGGADWTFSGRSLSATIDGHKTATEDGSMCTVSVKLVGVRQ